MSRGNLWYYKEYTLNDDFIISHRPTIDSPSPTPTTPTHTTPASTNKDNLPLLSPNLDNTVEPRKKVSWSSTEDDSKSSSASEYDSDWLQGVGRSAGLGEISKQSNNHHSSMDEQLADMFSDKPKRKTKKRNEPRKTDSSADTSEIDNIISTVSYEPQPSYLETIDPNNNIVTRQSKTRLNDANVELYSGEGGSV